MPDRSPIDRVGIGFDFHSFSESGSVVLGGVEVSGCPALIGHSDADVLTHAAMDAVLGAAGEVDIGTLFPDTDESYKDIQSTELARQVARMIREAGFRIVNMDAVLVCDRPSISSNRHKIRSRLAEAFGINASQVNLKGKTSEGIPSRSKGIEATVVVLLKNL